MKLLMAANWKMYKSQQEASLTLRDLVKRIGTLPADREVAVFAPFTALEASSNAVEGLPGFRVGGQNCYPAKEGAFTGEISPDMLRHCGCTWVLTGHSERRSLMGESNDFIGEKTAFALNEGLDVVLCVGETLQERDSGQLGIVLTRQLETGLAGVPSDILPERLAVAYEPVWAIGTGRVAGPAEIIASHALIREFLERRFPSQGKEIRILYGGSVKPENAGEIIALDNVNGVLVGGASLLAENFSRIVLA